MSSFVANVIKIGIKKETLTGIDTILSPVSLFLPIFIGNYIEFRFINLGKRNGNFMENLQY